MEVQNSSNITSEALAEEKRKKRQKRIFGLLVLIDLILFVLLAIELILIFTH